MARFRKKYAVVLVIIVLLVLIVCLLPFPVKVNENLKGMRLSEDGKTLYDVDIKLQGWRYNYLFRNDDVKMSAALSKTEQLDVEIQMEGEILQINKNLFTSSALFYDGQRNGYFPVRLYFDSDDKLVFIEINWGNERVYYATARYFERKNANEYLMLPL